MTEAAAWFAGGVVLAALAVIAAFAVGWFAPVALAAGALVCGLLGVAAARRRGRRS